MKVTVVSNINARAIMKKRGLEPNGRVQRMLTAQCAKEMDPYTPFRQGVLKNTKIIGTDSITYNTPYAKNMYYGPVMVDPVTKKAGILIPDKNGNKVWISRKGVKKIKSNREYKYYGAPKRGKLWDVRMWADKKHKILNQLAKAVGGSAE